MKKRVNISLDDETLEALRNLANNKHTTVSQYITDIVWKEIAPSDDFMNKPE